MDDLLFKTVLAGLAAVSLVGFTIIVALFSIPAISLLVLGLTELYSNDPHLKLRRDRYLKERDRRQRENIRKKNIEVREAWIEAMRIRGEAEGGQVELLSRGNFDSDIILKVKDPSGAYWPYISTRMRGSWHVYLLEDEQVPWTEVEIIDWIAESEKWAPWIVSVAGVFPHKIFEDTIEYHGPYTES